MLKSVRYMADIKAIETETKFFQPYGKRIIGLEDPSNMTLQEFNNSKELLFHGSKEPLKYNPKFVYDDDFYTTQDGSLTLGVGIYTTTDQDQAKNYSYVRQIDPKDSPLYVTTLLPNQAVMLDLRERDSLAQNAPISKEMFERWREKYVRYYKNQDRSNLEWYINQFEAEYMIHLDNLSKYPDIDLRSMLWTGPDKRTQDGWYPGPPWVDLFNKFMTEEGYDGVIYIEDGEEEKRGPSPTYCFYNLEKLGDYETWHPKKN